MDLSNIPTNDLIREICHRRNNTYLEDAEWQPTRGRGHSSLGRQLLESMQIGEVKRLYHNDVYCHHHDEKGMTYYCGISKARDRLKKKGIIFRIYHESEHIAIVARIS